MCFSFLLKTFFSLLQLKSADTTFILQKKKQNCIGHVEAEKLDPNAREWTEFILLIAATQGTGKHVETSGEQQQKDQGNWWKLSRSSITDVNRLTDTKQ